MILDRIHSNADRAGSLSRRTFIKAGATVGGGLLLGIGLDGQIDCDGDEVDGQSLPGDAVRRGACRRDPWSAKPVSAE